MPNIKVHPVVLLSIIDSYERRSTPRVFGTLLGNQDKNNNVEVTNCFAVLYKEKDGQLFIDLNLARELGELHRKVNPGEVIVGWFAVGAGNADDYAFLLHEYYSREATNPIHLAVDPTTDKGIDIKAYVSAPFGVPNPDERSRGTMFSQVNSLSLVAGYETEMVGLKACVKSMTESHPRPIQSEFTTILQSCEQVIGLLDIILNFIDNKILGQSSAASWPPNSNDIGRQLMSMVESIIPLDDSNIEVMNAVLKDLLMVIYLSNLSKTQLMLNEKLVLQP
ncbi:Eukaryotic translation initiation factor 3 subunit F, partial [Fragariocoptes setiger]